MPFETAFWVLLSVLAPTAVRWGWSRWGSRFDAWESTLIEITPWLYGIVPAYLALITGAVLGRQFGLYGNGLRDWLLGALVCAGYLAAGSLVFRRWRFSFDLPSPLHAALDEPRWSLYRAAGQLWTGMLWSGVLVGFGFAALEWALNRRPWETRSWPPAEAWLDLARSAGSALLFFLTGNFWLTLLANTGMILILRWRLNWKLPANSKG